MAAMEQFSQGRRVRRLSSVEATREDMIGGPSVLVPPKHLMASSNAYENARNFGVARGHLEEDTSSAEMTPRAASPSRREPLTTADRYAFAFDIDGVLVRGGKPLPDAVAALKILNGQNEYGIKV